MYSSPSTTPGSKSLSLLSFDKKTHTENICLQMNCSEKSWNITDNITNTKLVIAQLSRFERREVKYKRVCTHAIPYSLWEDTLVNKRIGADDVFSHCRNIRTYVEWSKNVVQWKECWLCGNFRTWSHLIVAAWIHDTYREYVVIELQIYSLCCLWEGQPPQCSIQRCWWKMIIMMNGILANSNGTCV